MSNLTFYFDRCFGKRFPNLLQSARAPFNVKYHHDGKLNFPSNMPDDEWLSIAGQNDWIVFSYDRRFHKEKPSLVAIKQHNVRCFYLPGGDATLWWRLIYFVRAQAGCNKILKSVGRPYVYRIGRNYRFFKMNLY